MKKEQISSLKRVGIPLEKLRRVYLMKERREFHL